MNKIQLMKMRIYPENLDTLFELSDFNTDTVNKYFDIKCGKWYTEDGWLVGENRECSAAMAITKESFIYALSQKNGLCQPIKRASEFTTKIV